MTTEDNQRVAEALEQWVNGLPPAPGEDGLDMGVLGDWIAVVSMVRISESGEPVTQYYLAMKNGYMLPHIARGLLGQGLVEMATQVIDLD